MCELSSAPFRLSAIRRKSDAFIARGSGPEDDIAKCAPARCRKRSHHKVSLECTVTIPFSSGWQRCRSDSCHFAYALLPIVSIPFSSGRQRCPLPQPTPYWGSTLSLEFSHTSCQKDLPVAPKNSHPAPVNSYPTDDPPLSCNLPCPAFGAGLRNWPEIVESTSYHVKLLVPHRLGGSQDAGFAVAGRLQLEDVISSWQLDTRLRRASSVMS